MLAPIVVHRSVILLLEATASHPWRFATHLGSWNVCPPFQSNFSEVAGTLNMPKNQRIACMWQYDSSWLKKRHDKFWWIDQSEQILQMMSGPCNNAIVFMTLGASACLSVKHPKVTVEPCNMVTLLGVTSLWVEVSPRVMSAPVGQLAVDEYGHWAAVSLE